MRIIAGEFSSRRIETSKGLDTRPTQEKVREAVFSSLGGFFSGGAVLDLYAGSGANGLEALSRGMDEAVFVDNAISAIRIIEKNVASLQVEDRCRIMKTTVKKALKILQEEGKQFSLIYMDPPYAKQENLNIIACIEEYGLLEMDGTIVVESDNEDEFHQDFQTIQYQKEVTYGNNKVTYYKRRN